MIEIYGNCLKLGGLWLRGNLHCHTTLSDGVLDPVSLIKAYEERGYHFLAISDHNILARPEDYRSCTSLVLLGALEVGQPHVICVGVPHANLPNPDHQELIDTIRGMGGFVVLNHPNWGEDFCHWPQEKMESLSGYVGIEIYNGVIGRLEGSSLATDRWDRLLSKGVHCWGFAHDDSHRPKDIGKGWICVQADEQSPQAICRSLIEGRFYASTGVRIEELAVVGERIRVSAPGAHCVKFIGRWGRELFEVAGEEAEYTPTGDELYVRVECVGYGGRAAWSQPFWVNRGRPMIRPRDTANMLVP